ncbi:MAG: hypothetical protein U0T02_01495 [Solirubrobacteraceae bacterium]
MPGRPTDTPIRPGRPRARRRHAVALALALTAALATLGAPASAPAAYFPGEPIDGPSADLRSVDGMDIALDGTGALVYVKRVGGADRVFASRLAYGAWSAPEQLDSGLPGGSSSPAVAVAPGGAVRVAFLNGGALYTLIRPSADQPWSGPTLLYGGGPVGPPSISTSVHGKSYLAFAAPGAGGSDVRVAFARGAGGWSLVGAPLDVDPARAAGAGDGRPKVAASADGIGIVAWGEAGEIHARRVWGTQPSIVAPQASLPGSAGESPEIATLNDSSYAVVTWRQQVGPVMRGFVRRLRGSLFLPEMAVDGQGSPGVEDAEPPRVAASGSGRGMVVDTRGDSGDVIGTILGSRVNLLGPQQIDATPGGGAAHPAVAASSGAATLAIWEEAGGTQPEIVGRPYGDGSFDPQVTLSNADLGATDAEDGLQAAADGYGDIAVAFLQGPAGARSLVVASGDQPPGRFVASASTGFTRSRRPVVRWTTSRELWGGAVYTVTLDGRFAGTTRRTEFRLPGPLADGRYAWQVSAADRRGQQRAGGGSFVQIDGTPPTVEITGLPSRSLLAAGVRFRVDALDEPPLPATTPGGGGGAGSGARVPSRRAAASAKRRHARPGRRASARRPSGARSRRSRARPRARTRGADAAKASGLVGIRVEFGDGKVARVSSRRGVAALAASFVHYYPRTGRFRVRVVVRDVAGNSSVVQRYVTVYKPKPKPKRKRSRR